MTNKQFKKIRQQLKLSQEAMGKKIGKSVRQVQYYESGEWAIPTTVEKLLKFIVKEREN